MISEREGDNKVCVNYPETRRNTGALSHGLTLGSNINNTYIIELPALPTFRWEIK